MAKVQTTIPFRSRKSRYGGKDLKRCSDIAELLYDNEDKKYSDHNIENVDANNIDVHGVKVNNIKRNLKRSMAHLPKVDDSSNSSDEESCSPTKITRQVKKEYGKVAASSLNTKSADLARKALQCQSDHKLPSRDAEIDKLKEFLGNHLKNKTSGSLYVSGQPGTGKTACISYILQLPEFKDGFREVYVNCTMMKSAGSIYLRICRELNISKSGTTEKACLKAIEKYLTSKHKMTLLVLDEIDQLESKKQSVLYTIFEWPSWRDSHLVLIGVANALDLTDRVLPRLQARCELRPQLMHFPPYTKQQIIEIFTDRLSSEGAATVFSPVALQMLAAKISAISGDMRRALDIGRRVIELANRNKFTSTGNLESLINDKATTVELKEVLAVLNDVYGTSQKLETDVDETFPLQQKLVICSLMLMLTKGKHKDITVGKLHDVYKRVAVKRNIAAVDGTEFFGLCSLVETRGIIRLSGKKEPRAHKVSLQWDQIEVSNALKDKRLISAIINDASCLSR